MNTTTVFLTLLLLCGFAICTEIKPMQAIHETVIKLQHDLRWQVDMNHQSDMLWLQQELNNGGILLAMMQRYIPHIMIPKTDNQRMDAWRAFTAYWPLQLGPTAPKPIRQHAEFIPHLVFNMGEMRTIGVMTTITVAYLFHSALLQQNSAIEPVRMTPMIEMADGELRQGMQLYSLYHHHLWLNDNEGLGHRLPNLRQLAEWHLWWGLSLLESGGNTEASIYFFRSLLGDGVSGLSLWISSRNDIESSYTSQQIDHLHVENEYLSLPPFGGSTTCYRTYVLLPFQRLCRYSLLLQSIKQQEPQHSENTHVLNVLQKQLEVAITQINLDRKSADLKADVIGEWDTEQASLLFYVPEALICFGMQPTSRSHTVALYQNNLILFEKQGRDLHIKLSIPRVAIYNFSHESEGEVMLCWFNNDEQLYAHFRFPTADVGDQFMRQLALT